ncbi:MAG: tetratricopeptide repeat protein [Pseudomonadota bacterium]
MLAAGYPARSSLSENWPDCARLTPHVLALERAGAPGIAASDYLFNQASIYLQQMAVYGDALRLAERSLEMKRARLPESDRKVAVGWSMLGLAYKEAGRLEEAVAAQAESVRLFEAHDHGPETLATAYNNRASAIRALGQKTNDRALLEQAHAQNEKALAAESSSAGEESEEVASSLANLAVSHNALGQSDPALERSGQALAIWQKVLPPGDARLGTSLNTHGGLLLKDGQTVEAEGLLREALELRRRAYGRDDHPNVKNTVSWLVSCLLVLARGGDTEKRADAERLCTEFGLDWEKEQRDALQFPDPA